MKKVRLILNGKKAGLEIVRAAIFQARNQGDIEVRVTWEGGDVPRLVKEAHADGCSRIMVGGGDGTVKEAVDALMMLPEDERPELAILPLGTANDFATGCGIPVDLSAALSLAQKGNATLVDCVKANDEYFMNVASGGFGAQITTTTPVELKNFLGGGAYTLNGLVQALNFTPYHGTVTLPDVQLTGEVIVGAVCNSIQAGGGQQLAPNATINDGLLDVVMVFSFPKEALMQVVDELLNPSEDSVYVKRFQTPWAKWHSEIEIPTNLDGEPVKAKEINYQVMPKSIKLVLPKVCNVLS